MYVSVIQAHALHIVDHSVEVSFETAKRRKVLRLFS